jgi:hypothetical protein
MGEGHPNIIARKRADYTTGIAEYYMAIERDFQGLALKYGFIHRRQIVEDRVIAGERGEVGSIVLELVCRLAVGRRPRRRKTAGGIVIQRQGMLRIAQFYREALREALHRGLRAAWKQKTRRKCGRKKHPGCDRHGVNPPL